ncbi:terpene synthase family protein [Streptomyces montanisoli]|uniref:Terpene synthase n=1 Tax=Streptomyces montanisoli TaxID=2798581 RepID=A0A940MHT4_9ACTN|nr:hypothetical protein [Streptomyces montanisoli]MBP0458838.1 hypothetical protein [Streptomyces montanisoli]
MRRLPDLTDSFPGPFPVSPHAPHVQAQLEEWLTRYPLIGSERARHALCDITAHGIARTFPTADAAGLEIAADLLLWLTAFDDAHAEQEGARDPAALVRRIAAFLRPGADGELPGGTDPFGAALADVLARARRRAAPEQYVRLTSALRDSLYGLVWEAHELAGGGRVEVADYRAMRPHTVFVRTVVATAEPVLGYTLTPDERDARPVRELESAVGDLAGWINDLASYERERKRSGGRDPFSLPALLAAEHGCDVDKAFEMIAAMCEEEARRARARITELTAPDSASSTATATHARALESIAASYVWHIGHGRYGG